MNYDKLDKLDYFISSLARCKEGKGCNGCKFNQKDSEVCHDIRNNKYRSVAFHLIENKEVYIDG